MSGWIGVYEAVGAAAIHEQTELHCRGAALTSGIVAGYPYGGRARRGASGALYPQSALAGLNSCTEVVTHETYRRQAVMKSGSRAARRREPRQVREEAAVSGQPWVTWECLGGAG